ncbi:MAG: radical SAM protein [Deltaproteobacteria bacterium]|nr:radical SAM protein [Deltaproteobacteria bacterium]
MELSSAKTWSLCPVCLGRVEAWYVEVGGEVWLEKRCARHGVFRVVVWRGGPGWGEWFTGGREVGLGGEVGGCPFECGLCGGHGQRTCTLLVEVTGRCDLGCPVCYAGSGAGGAEPGLGELGEWLALAGEKAGGANLQLSGGEPTCRGDLAQVVGLARRAGFGFVQLNTNGLRLGGEAGYAERLAGAGLDSVFLQFDGVSPGVHEVLRGRDLREAKQGALEAAARAGLGVVLVATVAAGLNLGEVGSILDLAVAWSPVVRGVHFQPLAHFGRYPGAGGEAARVTLPEVIRAMEEQTGGRFAAEHFRPPGCEHPWCSFHGNFLVEGPGRVRPLGAGGGCCGPAGVSAREGATRAIGGVSRQWAAAPAGGEAAAELAPGELPSLDDFLARARRHTLAVSGMAFQDVWSLDLARVRECCIHVFAPPDRLVPFCLYNLTARGGERLYRP